MWHLNVPKIAHFYWGADTLPYLRYVSITSFIKHNPEWKVILWTSRRGYKGTGHGYPVECDNYLSKLSILPVEIRDINFETLGFSNNITEVHKSNIVNYHALATDGGVWSDMDIIYFKGIDNLDVNKPENRDIEAFVCIGFYGHSGGFYMSCANNRYFKKLLSLCPSEYKEGVYQCLGPDLCNKHFKTIDLVKAVCPTVDLGMDAVYAHDAYHIADMIKNVPTQFKDGSIGMHWYGGHPQWGKFFKETNGGVSNVPKSIIGDLLKGLSQPPQKTISIVMAYYNRQDQLNKTIESIKLSAIKDYELIIVDDGSDVPLICPEAKIIRVEKKDKWWTNPCIPYNMGFKAATGDIIVIQNPECTHNGDILSYVVDNIKPNAYLSFGCYALTKEETIVFQQGATPTIGTHSAEKVGSGWYNHSAIRPKAYHFCSAILRADLERVGGFDERYAHGVAFDDDDFIRTIKRIGMDVKIIDNPFTIHQFHTHFEFESPSAYRPLHTINQALYNNKYTQKSQTPPKERKSLIPPPVTDGGTLNRRTRKQLLSALREEKARRRRQR